MVGKEIVDQFVLTIKVAFNQIGYVVTAVDILHLQIVELLVVRLIVVLLIIYLKLGQIMRAVFESQSCLS